jgi:hypothetical protein
VLCFAKLLWCQLHLGLNRVACLQTSYAVLQRIMFATPVTCHLSLVICHWQVLHHKDKKPAGGCEELQQQFK